MILAADLFDPRRNNFTLVRLVLASSVIYTHCFWLIYGSKGVDDLSWLLGAPVSTYAVDGFFFLSGFLVYPSLLRLRNVGVFALARFARLWPGLALSVSLTILGGLFVTSIPPPAYFAGETFNFLAVNLTLASSAFNLTGVHCGAELCNVNGSLWTLPFEVRCYLILLVLGATNLAHERIMKRVILPATLAGALLWHIPGLREVVTEAAGAGVVYNLDLMDRLWFAFACGIAAYVFRDRLRLSWAVLVILFVLNVLAHKIGDPGHVRAIFIGYAVLCCGFLTAKNNSLSGTWPDYSYGMYIYAFPIMMALYASWPTSSHFALALANAALTLPVAALSWHVIEKPALDLFRRWRQGPLTSPLMQP